MSLNYFIDESVIKPFLKIGCSAMKCENMTCDKMKVNDVIEMNIGSDIDFTNQLTTPDIPVVGETKIYTKNDSKLYSLDSSGLESLVGDDTGDITVLNTKTQNLNINTTPSVTNHDGLFNSDQIKADSYKDKTETSAIDMSNIEIDLVSTDVKVNGSNVVVVSDSVTVLSDVTTVGSGNIITDIERTQIGTNATDINNNATNIGTNTTDIGTNATDIGNNTTDIGNNTTDIGTNATNIGNNTTDIGTKLPLSGGTLTGDLTVNTNINNTILNQQYSTGVLTGGFISILTPSATVYDISAGTGIITSPLGIVISVSWPSYSGLSHTYTGDFSSLYIDENGIIQSQSTIPTSSERRDKIFLGLLIHTNQINITVVSNRQDVIIEPANSSHDLFEALGNINTGGNFLSSPSALNLKKTAGTMFSWGSNFITDSKNPHNKNIPEIDTSVSSTFIIAYRDGSIRDSTATSVIPNEYDDGNGALNPGSVGNSEWTAMYVQLTPESNLYVLPGQYKYPNLSEASVGAGMDNFILPDLLSGGQSMTIGFVICKGNETNLQSANATILQYGSFGSGGVGSSVSTMQNVYDNSTAPQVVTNVTKGSIQFKSGLGLNNDPIFEILNDSNIVVASITGEGILTSEKLRTNETNIILGDNAFSSTNSISIGQDSFCGSNSVSIGTFSNGVNESVCLGELAVSTNGNSTSIGYNCVSNTDGVSIGSLSSSTGGTGNVCVGTSAIAVGSNNTLLGNNGSVTGNNTILLKANTNTLTINDTGLNYNNGVATIAATGIVDITNNLNVDGNVDIVGNITNVNDIINVGNIIPNNNSLYNLGTFTNPFADLNLFYRVLVKNTVEVNSCFLDTIANASPSSIDNTRFKFCNIATAIHNILRIGSSSDNGSLDTAILSMEHTTRDMIFHSTNDSTTSTTGGAIFNGGVGISKSLNIGNNLQTGGSIRFDLGSGVDVSLSSPAANPGLIISSGSTNNYSRFDMYNIPNATSGSRSFRMTYLGAGGGVELFRGATAFSAVSDRRLKKNIVQIRDGCAGLSSLKSYHYNYVDDEDDSVIRIGLMADEIEMVYPEIINTSDKTDEEGNVVLKDVKSVKYTELIPVLVCAINELVDSVKILKERITALENV